MLKCVCLLLLAAVSVHSAGNIAGKWSGSMRLSSAGAQDQEVALVLVLEQNGSELTGTFTPAGKGPQLIQKGRFEGDKVTFEIQGVNPSLKFDGALTGGNLKFKVEGTVKVAEADRQFNGTMDLKREE